MPRYTETRPSYLSVIVDGTMDITVTEQKSVCIRYVSENLVPTEVFFYIYTVDDAKGNTLAITIKDVLLRVELTISLLSGQIFDEAANVASTYNEAH